MWRWSGGKIYGFPLLQLIIFYKLFLAWSYFCLGRGLFLKVCISLSKEPFSLISAGRKLVAILIMKLVWFYSWRFLSFCEGKIFTKGIIFVSFLVLGAFENILLSGCLLYFKLLPRTQICCSKKLKLMFLSCWHNPYFQLWKLCHSFTQSSVAPEK